jgi:hypothetical protein
MAQAELIETLPTMQTQHEVALLGMPMSVEGIKANMLKVRELQASVLKENEDFGLIPGCGKKPTLLKSGAEKLAMAFGLSASYQTQRIDLPDSHREYIVTATIVTCEGRILGQGVGSCSTMESKYRWRKSERICPSCGATALIKDKYSKGQFAGGWLCFEKKGGCGEKFVSGDPAIEEQVTGRVENPDIADQYNTILKMAEKRAFVCGVLICTAASGLFTQDIEDLRSNMEEEPPAPPSNGRSTPAAPPRQAPQKTQPQQASRQQDLPKFKRLDLEDVRSNFNSCMDMQELDSAIKALGITKDHPDAQAVTDMYHDVKDHIQAAALEAEQDNPF